MDNRFNIYISKYIIKTYVYLFKSTLLLQFYFFLIHDTQYVHIKLHVIYIQYRCK